MAQVEVFSIDGEAIAIPDRMSGDEHDAPTVTIIVCDAGQYIDGSSDELRFIPPPPPPVIERVEVVSNVSVGTGVDMLDAPTSDLDAIAALEKHLAGLRGEAAEVADPEDDEPDWKRRIRERSDFSGRAPDGWW